MYPQLVIISDIKTPVANSHGTSMRAKKLWSPEGAVKWCRSLANSKNSDIEKKKKEHARPIKMSENALRKAQNHSQRIIAMLYCIVILATGLSITLYCTPPRVAEIEPVYVWFFTIMYLSSVISMICVLWFILHNRHASIEAIEKGDMGATKIMFSLRGEPVSLYLRIGACIFAAMSIVYSVCRAYEVISMDNPATPVLVFTSSRILFFIVQPIFFLLFHKLVILAYPHLFSAVLLHMLAANLCSWVDTAVEKISLAISATLPSKNLSYEEVAYRLKATTYFLPAVPEYCAIAAAIAYELSQRIGQIQQIIAHHHEHEETENEAPLKRHAGLIFGCVLGLFVLGLIFFLETIGHGADSYRSILHLSEITTLHTVALGMSIIGLVLLKRLKFSVSFTQNGLDENLLLITFFLTVNFFMASIVLCGGYLYSGILNEEESSYYSAELASVALELVQVIVQTYFIHDSFYRCCHDEHYRKTKPGRIVIALLSAVNFSLWMIYSFQVKHNDVIFRFESKLHDSVHQQGLHIFIMVVLPMVMLFRYHSSVCLAMAFTRIYEDEVTRYELMLRWVKKDTSKGFLQTQNTCFGTSWGTGKVGQPELECPSDMPGLQTRANSFPGNDSKSDIAWDRVDSRSTRTNSLIPVSKTNESSFFTGAVTSHHLEGGRRGTSANIEMAHIRLAASEFDYRMTERKWRQHKIKEKKALGRFGGNLKRKVKSAQFDLAKHKEDVLDEPEIRAASLEQSLDEVDSATQEVNLPEQHPDTYFTIH